MSQRSHGMVSAAGALALAFLLSRPYFLRQFR